MEDRGEVGELGKWVPIGREIPSAAAPMSDITQ